MARRGVHPVAPGTPRSRSRPRRPPMTTAIKSAVHWTLPVLLPVAAWLFLFRPALSDAAGRSSLCAAPIPRSHCATPRDGPPSRRAPTSASRRPTARNGRSTRSPNSSPGPAVGGDRRPDGERGGRRHAADPWHSAGVHVVGRSAAEFHPRDGPRTAWTYRAPRDLAADREKRRCGPALLGTALLFGGLYAAGFLLTGDALFFLHQS